MFASNLIGMSVDEAKSKFFDKLAVTTRLTKAERQVFNRVGATARTYARRSMKAASKKKLQLIIDKRRELARLAKRQRKTAAVQAQQTALAQELRALEKEVHSKPGEPPKTIKGTIKQQLYYGMETPFLKPTVVIGPVIFEPKSGAPETLEYGGNVHVGPLRSSIAARPFMGPAKEAVEPQIAGFFRDSV